MNQLFCVSTDYLETKMMIQQKLNEIFQRQITRKISQSPYLSKANGSFQQKRQNFIDFIKLKLYQIFLKMRLVGRNPASRRSEPQVALANLDKDYNQHLSFVPQKRVNQLHFAKRETCPTVYIGTQHQMYSNIQEQNTSVKCSTRVNSTNKKDNDLIDQCKILTLQQIKSINQPVLTDNLRGSSRMKSARKLFVSISKSNRTSESKQSRVKAEPKLSEIGGEFTLLRSLSNKKKIVDTVEIQMHENIPKSSFFCR